MRWCCSASSAASTSSSFDDDDQVEGTEGRTEEEEGRALANGGNDGGRRRKKKGKRKKNEDEEEEENGRRKRMPMRILGRTVAAASGGDKKVTTAGTGIGEKEGAEQRHTRRAPEGILKGTHPRAAPRAVQYADGTNSGTEAEEAEEPEGGEGRAMDSPPSCSSAPSSPPHLPTSPSSSSIDQYGPMLLRPCKRALLVLSSRHSKSPSTPPDCSFLASLRRSGWDIQACTPQGAVDEIARRRPVMVLYDARTKGKDELADMLRIVRGDTGSEERPPTRGDEDILHAVLVDKVPSERRMRQMMGRHQVQQFFLRSSSDTALCDQFSRLCSRLRAVPALFAVVEEAQQPIKICDERNIVQYVNRAYELVTGRTRATVLGQEGAAEPSGRSRLLNHVAAAAIAASATAAATAAVTWSASSPPPTITMAPPPAEESRNSRGRAGGGLEAETHGTGAPPASPGATDRRRSSDWQCIAVPTCSSSQQYVYVKRGSADAAFFRESSQKGRSPGSLVDAPITEALTHLGNILHRCDEETQSQLREAMRILSCSELYTPTITRFRENDRIASGYYDGLIRLHHPNRQRKRSVVDAFRDHQQRRASAVSNLSGMTADSGRGAGVDISGGSADNARRRVSTEIMSVLEREAQWDFDVIQLERVTDHHPLSSLGAKVFERWSVCEALQCPADVLGKWLTVIEANYQSGNAYHNATHAADVLQATSYFLNSDSVGQLIQDHHAPAALIAATVHDLDHPGRGNAFLMNTRQRLALLYNDQSVLENHHVALAFQLTLSQPGVNIFAKMPREEFAQMRQAIIDMVLATDMSRHFEHLAKFQQLMNIMPEGGQEEEDEGDGSGGRDRDANSLIICRMLVKCADIANPTREWRLCQQWAMRIVEEYFDQTAEEVEHKLPVTMKGFDRETCNVPLTQCTFVDMFARETFSLWCEFAALPPLMGHLEDNYARWKAHATEWDPKRNNRDLMGNRGEPQQRR